MENNSSLHDYKQKYPFLDIVYIMDGDEKVHYIAKQDVPRNTKITDTRYWQPIDLSSTSSEADDIFNNIVDVTDIQRNKALANISNQEPTDNGKLGYNVLDPTKPFIEQVTETNTIYEIRDVFDLGGTELSPVSVTIPAGCTLKFNGGMIKNCTLDCNNTDVDSSLVKIFDNVLFTGSFVKNFDYPEWYGYVYGEDLTPYTDNIYSSFNSVRLTREQYNVNSELRIKGHFYAPTATIMLTSTGYLSTQNDNLADGLHYVNIIIDRIVGGANKVTPYGLKIHNLNSSIVEIKEITRFSDCCILFEATRGIAYNKFDFGHVHEATNCLIRVRTVVTESSRGGWVNGNYFNAIRFSNGYTSNNNPNPNGVCMIWEDHSISNNSAWNYYGNIFKNCSFEGLSNNILTVSNFTGNVFQNCAIDGCKAPYIYTSDLKSYGNYMSLVAGSVLLSGKYNSFEIDYTRKNCNNLIYDSENLGEVAKYVAAPNIFYLKDMTGYYYNNGSAGNYYNLQINNDGSVTNIGTANVTKTEAIGITVVKKSNFSSFGFSLSEPKHNIGIRYTKYIDSNNIEQSITLNDFSAEADSVLTSIGAPSVNYVDRGGTTFRFNNNDNSYHRYWLDMSSQPTIVYFEFSVPNNVTEFVIFIQIGTVQVPTIKRFRLFSTSSLNYVETTKEVHFGSTEERMYKHVGYQYFDTTLGKYICWNGTAWVNLDGTALT